MAAPVYENGAAAGSLFIARYGDDREFTATDEEKLLNFAEHVSLAVTDARTVRDMNQAMHDSLTGLASRALFLDRLGDELDRSGQAAGQTALLFIDLDRFKEVNDAYGHAAGDLLLVGVAERLLGVVRDRDVAARFGGDEFAVLLRDVPHEGHAVDVAHRIITAVASAHPVPGGQTEVGASIGIALGGSSLRDGDELMRRGDVAMYEAKRRGRGCAVVFEPGMDTRPRHDTMEANVRRAIDQLTHSPTPSALA